MRSIIVDWFLAMQIEQFCEQFMGSIDKIKKKQKSY